MTWAFRVLTGQICDELLRTPVTFRTHPLTHTRCRRTLALGFREGRVIALRVMSMAEIRVEVLLQAMMLPGWPSTSARGPLRRPNLERCLFPPRSRTRLSDRRSNSLIEAGTNLEACPDRGGSTGWCRDRGWPRARRGAKNDSIAEAPPAADKQHEGNQPHRGKHQGKAEQDEPQADRPGMRSRA